MLNAVCLHLHVYPLLTYCFNKEMHYINAILSQDRVLYNGPATPQDTVSSYRSVYAPQNINLDQWVLYNCPATPQDMVSSCRSVYAPQNINFDQWVLYDCPATPQDTVSSYRSVYAPQNINFDQ